MTSRPTMRVTGARVYFLPVQTRMPLKFGGQTVTNVTCAGRGDGGRRGRPPRGGLGRDALERALGLAESAALRRAARGDSAAHARRGPARL